MKIGTFIVCKIRNVSALMFIVLIISFIINHFSNNAVISFLNLFEEEYSISNFECNKDFSIKNKTLILKDFIFEKGDGSCTKKLEKENIEKVILHNVAGGDVIEARIFAKYIKENKLPVLIKGYCYSACVDVLLHSPDRNICYSGHIGLHPYSAKDYNNPFVDYLGKLKEDSMLRAFKDTNINIEFIKNIYKNTKPEDIYIASMSELKSNKFIHKEIPCQSLKN